MNFCEKKAIWIKYNLFGEVSKTFKCAAIFVHHLHQYSLGFERVVT